TYIDKKSHLLAQFLLEAVSLPVLEHRNEIGGIEAVFQCGTKALPVVSHYCSLGVLFSLLMSQLKEKIAKFSHSYNDLNNSNNLYFVQCPSYFMVVVFFLTHIFCLMLPIRHHIPKAFYLLMLVVFSFSYVFDGQPPDLKKQELAKRYSKRADASEDLQEAMEVFFFGQTWSDK
ncbi:hypothetical protein Gotur_033899, partial [Gossypium turneri]